MITKEGKQVAISYSNDPIAMLQKAGLPVQALVLAKATWGLKAVMYPSGIKFIGPDGEVITSLKVTADALMDLQAATPFPYGFKLGLAVATAQVQQAGKAYGTVAVAEDPWPPAAIDCKPEVAPLVGIDEGYTLDAKLPAMSLLQGQATPGTAAPVYPVLSVDGTQDAVPLREAVGLYRPVNGTDPGSRYFLVADFGSLKVAARWRTGKLSMRVEGNGFTAVAAALADAGLNVGSKNHASLHVGADDPMVANKTVGSVVFAIAGSMGGQTPLLSPMPNLSIIYNKGK